MAVFLFVGPALAGSTGSLIDSCREAGRAADFERALESCGAAIDAGEVSAAVYRLRAFARARTGDEAGALADLDSGIALDPKDAASYRARGRLRRRHGDNERAISDFTRAIELGDDRSLFSRAQAYFELAGTSGKRKLERMGQDDLNRALELAPDDVEILRYRASRWIGTEQALADLDRVIELAPDSGAYRMRGRTQARLGAYQAALADFARALDLTEAPAPIHVDRGWTYVAQANYWAAEDDFRTALEQSPGVPGARAGLCRTYGLASEPAKAEPHCVAAIENRGEASSSSRFDREFVAWQLDQQSRSSAAYSRDALRDLQAIGLLKALGYYPAPLPRRERENLDVDPRALRDSIENFQRDQDLDPTGDVSPELVRALKAAYGSM